MSRFLFLHAFGVEICPTQDWSTLFSEFYPSINNLHGMINNFPHLFVIVTYIFVEILTSFQYENFEFLLSKTHIFMSTYKAITGLSLSESDIHEFLKQHRIVW